MSSNDPAVQAQKHFAALLQRLPEGTVPEKQVNNDVALYNTNTARGYAHGADRIELAKAPRTYGSQHHGKDLSAKSRRNTQVEKPTLNQLASLLTAVNAKTDICVTDNDYAVTLYRLLDEGYNLRARLSQEPEETASYIRIRKKLAEVDGEAATLEDANQAIKRQRLEIAYWKEEAAKLRAVPEALYGVRAAMRRLKTCSDELKQTVRYQNLDSQDLVQQFAKTYKTYSGVDLLSDTKVLEKRLDGAAAGAGALSVVKQAEISKDMAEYLQGADPFRDSKTTLATALQMLNAHVTEVTQRTPLVPDPIWDSIKWDDEEDSPENLKKKKNIPSFANLGRTIGVIPATELPKGLATLATYNRPTPELGLVRAAVVACKHVSTTFTLISTLSKIRLDLQTELEAAKAQILHMHVELKDAETKGGKSTRGGSTLMGGAPTTERKTVAAAVQRLQENGRAKVRELSRFATPTVPIPVAVPGQDDDTGGDDQLLDTLLLGNGSANFANSTNSMMKPPSNVKSSPTAVASKAPLPKGPTKTRGGGKLPLGRKATADPSPDPTAAVASSPAAPTTDDGGNSMANYVNQWSPKSSGVGRPSQLLSAASATVKPLVREMSTQTGIGLGGGIGSKEKKAPMHRFVNIEEDSFRTSSNKEPTVLPAAATYPSSDSEDDGEEDDEPNTMPSNGGVDPLHASELDQASDDYQDRDEQPFSALPPRGTDDKEVMTIPLEDLIEQAVRERLLRLADGREEPSNSKASSTPGTLASANGAVLPTSMDPSQRRRKISSKPSKSKRSRKNRRNRSEADYLDISSSSASEGQPSESRNGDGGEASDSYDTDTDGGSSEAFSEGEMIFDLGWVRDESGVIRTRDEASVIVPSDTVRHQIEQVEKEEQNHRRRRHNRKAQRNVRGGGEAALPSSVNGKRRNKPDRRLHHVDSGGNTPSQGSLSDKRRSKGTVQQPEGSSGAHRSSIRTPSATKFANSEKGPGAVGRVNSSAHSSTALPPSPISEAIGISTPVKGRTNSLPGLTPVQSPLPGHRVLSEVPAPRLVPLSPLAPITLTAVQRKESVSAPPPEQSIKQAMAMMRGARLGRESTNDSSASGGGGGGLFDEERVSTAATNRTTKSRRSIMMEASPIVAVTQATVEGTHPTRPIFQSPGAVVAESDQRAIALNETRQMLCALKGNSAANPFARGNYDVRASHQLVFNPRVQIASGPKEAGAPLKRIGGAL